METKNNKVKLETIRRKLGFTNSSYVDPEGLAGGLALWWNVEVEITVEEANKNFMHVTVSDKVAPSCWASTFVYGCPSRDFNQVLSVGDKIGGHLPSQNALRSFHEMISDCGLVDLEFKGPKFTWRNNREEESFIMERIDMAFADSKWRELHEHAMVFVTDAWNQQQVGLPMLKVCKKLRACKEGLKDWSRRKFGVLKLRIEDTKEQLLVVQKQLSQGFNHELVAEERGLTRCLEDLWQKEAMYWHQRSRIKWLQMGDRNSRFFHLSTIHRRQRNQILKLKDKEGNWKSEPKEVAGIIKLHFQELYEGPGDREYEDLISLIDPIISPECNASLVRNVTKEEVKMAVFEMGPLKAPGSDGFPGLFYQHYWEIVGDEVFQAVQRFFQEGVLLKEVSHTNVTLIPKVPNPESMNQLRPISLCRFIYKVVSKVLTNRLQPFIPGIISEQQSAFIHGRQIQDNIIVAHEVFHFLKHKKSGKKASVAVKLDLSKAYDRVCWDFLFRVMEKMGFDGRWIDWVKQCVCSVKYSITVNGGQVCSVSPSRGLRQGDPLSPYLFLIVADVFSILMQKAVANKSIGGIRMKKRGPVVSHLLFADDSLIFLDAVPQSCLNFMDLVACFSEASGLSLNIQKSSLFFSPNIEDSLKEEIKGIMGMEEMKEAVQYLGLPAFWGRSKKKALGYLRDKIMRKAQGWGNDQLNHAGKEVIIKSAFQPIPMYTFLCFKVPSSLCACLDSVTCNFWWGKGVSGRKIHWGAWHKLSSPKSMGGMGFKDFESFNIALLAKQFWRMMNNPNALWVKVLKSLYFPKKSCMDAVRGSQPSWIWSSLLEGRKLIKEGTQWNVGNGELIRLWEDKWIPDILGGVVSKPVGNFVDEVKVAEFINPTTKVWDRGKLECCIPLEEVQKICNIPISLVGAQDKLIWRHTNSGKYTVKSGYAQKVINSMKGNPAIPSCSFIPSKSMWNRLWRVKAMHKVRMFVWKAVKN
ncbi:hypothetical protein RHGRI_028084 [Rhododendron griersonianum]|uniref:Reverse transcriptase domain-containing protein n=1 Tax=Rhododendron griersonianum TaxID=479676 RepID=A0AAV6IGQ5_9ERIC|nr:hypothetical protein RHGRI_028084 [Rhododendron griersonianum]